MKSENEKTDTTAAHQRDVFSLYNALILFFILNTILLLGLWGYGIYGLVSTDVMEATFSFMLATEENLRILYASWLSIYAIFTVVTAWAIILDPIYNNKRLEHDAPHNRCCKANIFNVYRTLFIVFSITKFIGLFLVLVFPVSNPDLLIAHYIAAALAFGSAIATSWILFSRRVTYRKWTKDNPKFPQDPDSKVLILNGIYCFIESVVAIVFVIESLQDDYATTTGKGFIEFLLTIFIFFDFIWVLVHFQHEVVVVNVINVVESN